MLEKNVEEANHGMKWSDLDCLLVKLGESCAIRTTVVWDEPKTGVVVRGMEWASFLLPEMMKRGAVDLSEKFGGPYKLWSPY